MMGERRVMQEALFYGFIHPGNHLPVRYATSTPTMGRLHACGFPSLKWFVRRHTGRSVLCVAECVAARLLQKCRRIGAVSADGTSAGQALWTFADCVQSLCFEGLRWAVRSGGKKIRHSFLPDPPCASPNG
jgi:hypothetical protein